MQGLRVAVVWGMVLALAGCTNLPSAQAPDAGIDGVACVGRVGTPGPGLAEAHNPVLLAQAQGASGKGGVCAAKVFAVTAPTVLYRVYDASRPWSKFGGWWSLQRPSGSRDDYRADNAICKAWSQLDVLAQCELRPGSEVVIGTTQSADCAPDAPYPKTATLQVYVANDGKAGIVHVGQCAQDQPWP